MQWLFPEKQYNNSDDLIDYLLDLRGIINRDVFLSPDLETLHHWSKLNDANRAAEVILEAIAQGKKIWIHGDYDVDGVTATSMMWDFLYRELKADVKPFIPSRFDQGYGLTESSMAELLEAGAELVISVDCGIKDLEIIETYTRKGLQFVITDHHTPRYDAAGNVMISPHALATVHPLHPAGQYPCHEISGAAVAWKLICALTEKGKIDFDCYKYLDLVALSTVCDVMPLIDENRIFVTHGLNFMNQTKHLGLKVLLEQAGVKTNLETYHMGFVIGPRLNAAGRMQDALDAVRLLTTQSEVNARKFVAQLEELNGQRQELTKDLLESAIAQVADQVAQNSKVLVAYGEDWPEGIVGLIAGKLSEMYYRPTIVGTIKNGTMTASARSIKGFHIANALNDLSEMLVRFGGHELAAGLTLEHPNLESFIAKINAIADQTLTPEDLNQKLKVDAVADISRVNLDLVRSLNKLAPFGQGNSMPTFAFMGVRPTNARYFGDNSKHVAFHAGDVEFIAFNGADKYRELLTNKVVDVAGNLDINEWKNVSKVQVKIRDIKKPE